MEKLTFASASLVGRTNKMAKDPIFVSKDKIMVQGIYYSNHRILFIGEGDFSFSSSLATRFGVANNIVATSLDSKDDLKRKYDMDAIKNINNLISKGAQVIYGVDACNMATESGSILSGEGNLFFDVINFSFPHAGFFGSESDPKVIKRHQMLMQYFFTNAAFMLSPRGLVYVSHKCGPAYDAWNLQAQAEANGLAFVCKIPFHSSDFPGYKHRRGSGSRAGQVFKLGNAATYIFEIRDCVWIDNIVEDPLKTQKKNAILLQLSKMGSIKAKARKTGHATTPLLQLMAMEVARLETLKLRKREQRKLNSLKLMLKVIPAVVETPSAVHKILSVPVQAAGSCKKTLLYWRKIRRGARFVLNVVNHEKKSIQLEEHGFEASKAGFKNGKEHTLFPELCAEQSMCDSLKDGCPSKQQCELPVESVSEIHVSDDIADGNLLESEGEEDEDYFGGSHCAFTLETQTPHSSVQDVIPPENIALTGHFRSEESNHMSTIMEEEDYVYFLLYQNSNEDCGYMPKLNGFDTHKLLPAVHKYQKACEDHDDMPELEGCGAHKLLSEDMEDHSDIPELEVFGVCKLSSEDTEDMEDMEDMEDTEDMEDNYFLSNIMNNWMHRYFFSCFGTKETTIK